MRQPFGTILTLALVFGVVSVANALPASDTNSSRVNEMDLKLPPSGHQVQSSDEGLPRRPKHSDIIRSTASRPSTPRTRRLKAVMLLSDQTGLPPSNSTVFVPSSVQNTTTINTSVTMVPASTSISSTRHKAKSRKKTEKSNLREPHRQNNHQ